jgi:peptidoglycan/LPS O-acetylase OafA/YrhL
MSPPHPASPAPTGSTQVQNLDALRAIAVLLVVLFHYRLLAVGWIGVSIFFVISGFLITRILLGYRVRFGLGEYLGVFYARRALRIFPIYYLYVGFWSLVAAVAFVPSDFALVPLVTYSFNFVRWSATYEGSRIFTHLWSLSVEEQFYLVYPLVVFALGRRRLVHALIAIVVLSPALRFIAGLAFEAPADPIHAGRVIAVASFLQLDGFALGGLIALGEARLARLPARVFAPGAVGVSLLLAGALIGNALAWRSAPLPLATDAYFVGASSLGLPVNPFDGLQHVWVYSVVSFAAGLAICVVLRALQRPLALLRPLNAIGRVSYGIYLYHFALISVWERVYPGVPKASAAGLGVFGLYLASVLAVAALSHRWIETPFNALKPEALGRIAGLRARQRRREATP